MKRPTRVDLTQPETWPPGWELQPEGQMQIAYLFRVDPAPLVLEWWALGSPARWTWTSLLPDGTHWHPMPPAPPDAKGEP